MYYLVPVQALKLLEPGKYARLYSAEWRDMNTSAG